MGYSPWCYKEPDMTDHRHTQCILTINRSMMLSFQHKNNIKVISVLFLIVNVWDLIHILHL